MPPRLPVEARLSRTVLILMYLAIVLGAGGAFALSSAPQEIWDAGMSFAGRVRSLW